MKPCHFINDQEAGSVLIAGCIGGSEKGIEHCTCNDHVSQKRYGKTSAVSSWLGGDFIQCGKCTARKILVEDFAPDEDGYFLRKATCLACKASCRTKCRKEPKPTATFILDEFHDHIHGEEP